MRKYFPFYLNWHGILTLYRSWGWESMLSLMASSDRTWTGPVPGPGKIGLHDIMSIFSHCNMNCTCSCSYALALQQSHSRSRYRSRSNSVWMSYYSWQECASMLQSMPCGGHVSIFICDLSWFTLKWFANVSRIQVEFIPYVGKR